jgi:glyoxylase-like metal-dependent hydrolase (beta-lactamase superfamily II)
MEKQEDTTGPNESLTLLKAQNFQDSIARIKHTIHGGSSGKETENNEKTEDIMNFPNSWIVCVSKEEQKYIMVDVPKYSKALEKQIRKFCNGNQPLTIVVTNQNSIYYDNAPGNLVIRRSDAIKWAEAFPGIEIVIHRHDIFRDLQKIVTQRLDGYGPWGINLESGRFVDLGHPLQAIEGLDGFEMEFDVENYESPEMEDINVRESEYSKHCIAVYAPGHSFGSMCFIIPQLQAICSGNTIPPINLLEGKILRMDSQGIVTTNRAGISRQIESAQNLVSSYADLFHLMLPSRGSLQRFPVDVDKRTERLTQLLKKFEEYKRYEEGSKPQ